VSEVVINEIREVFENVYKRLGPIEMEWVYDGVRVWIVQLHKSARTVSYGNVIVPGQPEVYIDFDVSAGLENLRALIATMQTGNKGIRIHGNVGVTSHFGDVLRKAGIPSMIERM